MGRPPKADGCGKAGLGPGTVPPGMGNKLGAALEAPHMVTAGTFVVAGGPNWRFPRAAMAEGAEFAGVLLKRSGADDPSD